MTIDEAIEHSRYVEKIKYWLFVRNKGCRRACPFCEYYDLCRADLEGK